MSTKKRKILIDDIPCFTEVTLPVTNNLNIRFYFPINANIFKIEYIKNLFITYGFSEEEQSLCSKLINIYNNLGLINDPRSGKNRYWNQSFLMFRDNTMLYEKSFNTMKEKNSDVSFRDLLRKLTEKEKRNIIKKTKDDILNNINTENEDFSILLKKAMYETDEPLPLTKYGLSAYANRLISKLDELNNLHSNELGAIIDRTKYLKEWKKLTTVDESDHVRTPLITDILDRIEKILTTFEWFETEKGELIFCDITLIDGLNLHEITFDILFSLKYELKKFLKSKIPGLKNSVKVWISIIDFYSQHPDKADNALLWIKNQFSDKTVALRILCNTGKFFFNRLISLFCRRALALIHDKEQLTKSERRLFILLNMGHRFADYCIIANEPIFLNYMRFSERAVSMILLSFFYENHDDSEHKLHRENLTKEIKNFLAFYPLWKSMIREEDKIIKQEKRNRKKEIKDDTYIDRKAADLSSHEDEATDEIIELDESYNVESYAETADVEDQEKPLNPKIQKTLQLITKYGKPIHQEVIKFQLEHGDLKLLAFQKNVPIEELTIKFNEAIKIVQKHL